MFTHIDVQALDKDLIDDSKDANRYGVKGYAGGYNR